MVPTFSLSGSYVLLCVHSDIFSDQLTVLDTTRKEVHSVAMVRILVVTDTFGKVELWGTLSQQQVIQNLTR
jgi:hypothetical protein